MDGLEREKDGWEKGETCPKERRSKVVEENRGVGRETL